MPGDAVLEDDMVKLGVARRKAALGRGFSVRLSKRNSEKIDL